MRRSEAGATVIEFAVVFPVFILMFSAVFETGAFILKQNQLRFATESAARSIRLLSVGPIDNSTTTPQKNISEFKTLLCAKMPSSSCTSDIAVDVRKGATFADIKAVMPNPATKVGRINRTTTYTETYEPGGPGMTGSLIVTYDWRFAFPGIALLFGNVGTYPGIRRLVATVVFRNEGQ